MYSSFKEIYAPQTVPILILFCPCTTILDLMDVVLTIFLIICVHLIFYNVPLINNNNYYFINLCLETCRTFSFLNYYCLSLCDIICLVLRVFLLIKCKMVVVKEILYIHGAINYATTIPQALRKLFLG